MRRYFLYLAYNGANYCGWQVQPNGLAVQEVLEKALFTLSRQEISITGAGRTDSGVHARSMVAHFDLELAITDKIELVRRLNSILPLDITIYDICEVNSEAHARFDAMSRSYSYHLTTDKDPFLHHLKYRIVSQLDLQNMNSCARILFEYEDFTSFSKLHTDVKTNNCEIIHANWEQTGNDYVFTIKANRFLRNMVRSIVGTLVEAGRGRLDEAGMRAIIEAKDRAKAGMSVPGHALFLEKVEYSKEVFELNKKIDFR